MANPQNLLPPLKKNSKRAREMGRKGGKANLNNPKTIRSAKLREIKKRVKKGQLKTGDEEWLLARVENKELLDLDMLNWLDKLRRDSPDEFYDAKLLGLYNQIARQLHPPTQQVNVNVKTLNLNEPIPPEMLKLLTEDFNDGV